MMYFLLYLIIFSIILSTLNSAFCVRTIQTKINPGCWENSLCKKNIYSLNLIHSTSQENDSILNFMSTTVHQSPEFVIFPDNQVTIDWGNLLFFNDFKTLHLKEKPENAIGFILKEWPTPRNFVKRDAKWAIVSIKFDSRECKTVIEGPFDKQRSVVVQTQIDSTEFCAENLQIGPHSMLIKITMEGFNRSEISEKFFELYLYNFARKQIKLDRTDKYELMQLKDEEVSTYLTEDGV